MHRLFVAPEALQAAPGLIELRGGQARYLASVLRLGQGAPLEVFDGRGSSWRATLVSVTAEIIELQLEEALPASPQAGADVTLVQALAKGDKLELIIQKATELGVRRIVPLAAERSVVKLEAERALARQERWQRIAQEAARQCGRADVPVIEVPIGWDELLANLSKEPERRGVLLHPQAPLRLSQAARGVPQLCLCVGPEGGFTAGEREGAARAGLQEANLGPLVLRTETVALAALAVVQHLHGALG